MLQKCRKRLENQLSFISELQMHSYKVKTNLGKRKNHIMSVFSIHIYFKSVFPGIDVIKQHFVIPISQIKRINAESNIIKYK